MSEGNIFQKHPIITFFTLCYIIGFGLLIPLILFGIGILGLLAASSASIAGILTAYMTEGKQGIKDLFRGFNRWRSNPIYYFISIIIPLGTILIAIGISTLFGNPSPSLGLDQWVLLPLIFLFVTVQAGLGEEIGWRGYANSKLIEKTNALNSCLIIGIAWAFWHLPLYFFPGTTQYEFVQQVGFLTFFLFYSLYIIAAAIIHGWIYYVSNGNLWLPILLHGSINAFAWLFTYDNLDNYGGPTMLIALVIIWIIFAGVIILIYGPNKFKRTNID